MTDDAHAPCEGALVHDRWKLVTKLDPLGEGRVWKALDTRPVDGQPAPDSDVFVVVKFAPPRSTTASADQYHAMLKDFVLEAHVLDELDAPNVVRALAVHEGPQPQGEPDWPAYVVREFVNGETLAMALEAHDGIPLGADAVHDVAQSLLPTLHDLHAQGVFYRALLPEHIVRRPAASGEGYDYVLIDFGAARSGSFERWAVRMRAKQHTTRVLGMDHPADSVPPAYRAPEYLDAENPTWDARSDVWAAGVLLWWLSTGKLPFDAPGHSVQHDILTGRRPEYAMVAPPDAGWLGAPLTAALASDPANRPQTPLELLDRIAAAHGARFGSSSSDSPLVWSDEELVAVHEEVLAAERGGAQAVFERWAQRLGTGVRWVSARAHYYQNRERIVRMLEQAQPGVDVHAASTEADVVPVAPQARQPEPAEVQVAAVAALPGAPATEPVALPVAAPTTMPVAMPEPEAPVPVAAELAIVPEPASAPVAAPAVAEPAPETAPALELVGSSDADAPDYVAIVRYLVDRRATIEAERVTVDVRRDELVKQLEQLDLDHARISAEADLIDKRLGGLAA